MIVIVPNALRDAINAQLDSAMKDYPEATLEDRTALYGQLLDYFDKHGVIPDFKIKRTVRNNQPKEPSAHSQIHRR